MWTLENIFYFTGSIFFVVLMSLLIASGVAVVIGIKKMREMESDLRLHLKKMEEKTTDSSAILSGAVPLLLSSGIGLGYKLLRRKILKS